MKLRLLILTVLLSGFNVFSQTKFKSGYFIHNNGTKTVCLIKNEDWAGSPNTFEYKLSENDDVKLGSINNIKEFSSGESYKYIRVTLDVDQSTDVVNNLTDVRNPVMKKETLFLKTFLEGKASLYYTERENIKRYFYKVADGEIEQLIYKRYMATPTKMGTNERYKQQLATTLKCSDLKESSFENLEYKKNKLVNIITNYNNCENSKTIVYNKKEKGHWFNLSIRPGVSFSSLSIQAGGKDKIEFDNETGFRIGLEMEFVLPFNNDKWAIIFEPTYRSYKSEKKVKYISALTFDKYTNITATYNSISFPLGARHYFYLNDKSKIFINGAIAFDILLDSGFVSSEESLYDLKLNADIGTVFGIGYNYNNKFSFEAQVNPGRKVLEYTNFKSSFRSFSCIVGYIFL